MKNITFLSKITVLSIVILSVFLNACAVSKNSIDSNPAATGFNQADSDAKAIAIADEVMTAMGGRRAWDKTRYITWNFFGFRKLTWDKKMGDVRIENIKAKSTTLLNVNTMKGMAKKGDAVVTDSVELATLLDKAKKIWINDSYWLVMPFKLKDSGVTLKYLGEETEQNQTFQVLQLTFEKVGVTPENKYKVYVNATTHLVSKWAFFRKNTDEKPEFENIWSDYLPQGKILLSGNRGRTEGSLSEIKVDTKLPKTFFSKF
jgi:hypothetical protein